MPLTIDIAEFRALVREGKRPTAAVRLAGASADPVISQDARTVAFVFSDNSVDRYGDTIDARGWELDDYRANPIALFGHNSSSVENIIGRARNVCVEGQRLVGDIEFMNGSVNQTAETVYQMVTGGFLRTVSVGFQPIEWSLSNDRSRPGGIDFKRQALLEVSLCPVPANPNAMAKARAAGIDVSRLMRLTERAPPTVPRSRSPHKIKSLQHVSWLAAILSDLGMLEGCVELEALAEGDESTVAQRLTDVMNALGQVLIDMTTEEVDELLAAEGGPDIAVSPIELMAARVGIFRRLRHASYEQAARLYSELGDEDAARRARVREATALRLGLI